MSYKLRDEDLNSKRDRRFDSPHSGRVGSRSKFVRLSDIAAIPVFAFGSYASRWWSHFVHPTYNASHYRAMSSPRATHIVYDARARARYSASYHVGRFPMESWVHVGSREGPLHADRECACRATARRPIDSPLFRRSERPRLQRKKRLAEPLDDSLSQLVSS